MEEIHKAIGGASDDLMLALIDLVKVSVYAQLVPSLLEPVESATVNASKVMAHLKKMQDALLVIADLSSGRVAVLHREAGLPLEDSPKEGDNV